MTALPDTIHCHFDRPGAPLKARIAGARRLIVAAICCLIGRPFTLTIYCKAEISSK
ncbi:MAG: hypothetical protein H0W72_16935 [Planctomycetes bacterium]|nr:hypothetical protein [Planctomycetota bacterium]